MELLGPNISASIDLYEPARVTLFRNDLSPNWMPCLRGEDATHYEPLGSFEWYNPRMQYISYACGLDMMDQRSAYGGRGRNYFYDYKLAQTKSRCHVTGKFKKSCDMATSNFLAEKPMIPFPIPPLYNVPVDQPISIRRTETNDDSS
eukprot:scaffold18078_cov147-Amphora_coffeaeformis.AAC.6